MDINVIVQDLIGKIMSDDSLKSRFFEDPIKTVESLAGIDLPNDQIKSVVDGIMSKVGVDNVSDALNNIKKLF